MLALMFLDLMFVMMLVAHFIRGACGNQAVQSQPSPLQALEPLAMALSEQFNRRTYPLTQGRA